MLLCEGAGEECEGVGEECEGAGEEGEDVQWARMGDETVKIRH